MNYNEIVSNVNVYGLDQSIKASKYPMLTDITKASSELTNTCKKLGSSGKGEGHDNWLKGIIVQFDLTFTNKAWVEAERYHWFEIVSSQSTMHKMAKFDIEKSYIKYVDNRIVALMKELIEEYNNNPTPENYLKLLYNNPAGFKITAGMTTNYRQLKTIYSQRKNHRLPEWVAFCQWIETLPYAKELICK